MFLGVRYDVRYVTGSLGWVSQVLDPLLTRRLNGVKEQPVVFVSSALAAELGSGLRATGDVSGDAVSLRANALRGHILMWCSPAMFRADVPTGAPVSMPGQWFDVAVLWHRDVLHVYQCFEAGRRLLSSLVFSSDAHMTLRDLEQRGTEKVPEAGESPPRPQDAAPRPPPVARYSAGSFYGDVMDTLSGEDASQFGFYPFSSLVITRRLDDVTDRVCVVRDVFGCARCCVDARRAQFGAETFVPARYAYGLLPDALLSDFQLWQSTPSALRGYPRVPSESCFLDVTLENASERQRVVGGEATSGCRVCHRRRCSNFVCAQGCHCHPFGRR